MRLNKLNLDIKLALKIKVPKPIKPLEFASIKHEKGVQKFMDEYAAHYESEAVFDRIDEILNRVRA